MGKSLLQASILEKTKHGLGLAKLSHSFMSSVIQIKCMPQLVRM